VSAIRGSAYSKIYYSTEDNNQNIKFKLQIKKGASMAVEKELIALRKDYKISQKQISKAIGLSEEQYRRKELGQYDWRATEMFAIRNYLKPFIGPRSLNDIFFDKTTQNVYKAS